ncbi:MAG: flagellar basal body L-ring protein FlgH [Rhodospirillales bacterium]
MRNECISALCRSLVIGGLVISVAGCNVFNRLSEVGKDPQISSVVNPMARRDYKPVTMPMPAPYRADENPNSLWRIGAKAFFKDIRAKAVGDIITVQLNLSDSATLANKTERERDDSETTAVNNILGFETNFNKVFPNGVDPGNLLNFSNQHETTGDGDIARSESITLTFAATITQILPNGNLVVFGSQEIRVNKELRELMVTGVIRPEDIESDNTIAHTKIAEMRVAYGGRGTLSDLQAPRWGTQLWDILFPF